MDGKKLVLLTEENFNKYADTVVRMRSPLFCHSPEPYYCNLCCGEEPYMINMRKMGLGIQRMSGTLMNLKLKKFHDMTVKINRIQPESVLHFKDRKTVDMRKG
jgi:hypothetical protein